MGVSFSDLSNVLASTTSSLSLAILVSILSMAVYALSIVRSGELWKGDQIKIPVAQTINSHPIIIQSKQ